MSLLVGARYPPICAGNSSSRRHHCLGQNQVICAQTQMRLQQLSFTWSRFWTSVIAGQPSSRGGLSRQHCATLIGTVTVPSFPVGPETASMTHAPRLTMMAPK